MESNLRLAERVNRFDYSGPSCAAARFEHGGGLVVVGSSCLLIIYPNQRVVIAWLQNSDVFRGWPIFKVQRCPLADGLQCGEWQSAYSGGEKGQARRRTQPHGLRQAS